MIEEMLRDMHENECARMVGNLKSKHNHKLLIDDELITLIKTNPPFIKDGRQNLLQILTN